MSCITMLHNFIFNSFSRLRTTSSIWNKKALFDNYNNIIGPIKRVGFEEKANNDNLTYTFYLGLFTSIYKLGLTMSLSSRIRLSVLLFNVKNVCREMNFRIPDGELLHIQSK